MNHLNSSFLVSVGMVTWNSARDLPTCLEGLARQSIPFELIVVDNASTDGSVSLVQSKFPQAVITRNSKNEGYCKGHNQAIGLSHGKYYLPINPDVRLEANYIESLLALCANDPDIGMTGGKLRLVDSDGVERLDTTGLFMDRKRRQYLRGHRELDTGQYEEESEVFGIDGAAPLYRRTMLEDIKVLGEYFDESFFAHKEDVDLAWRARLFGWRAMYTPTAVGYHRRSFRPGRRKAMADEVKREAVKNRYLLLLKNETPEGWKRDWFSILWYDFKILGFLLLFERSSLKVLSRVRQLYPQAMRWRSEIMKRKRVSGEELLKWFV